MTLVPKGERSNVRGSMNLSAENAMGVGGVLNNFDGEDFGLGVDGLRDPNLDSKAV